jgi:hypothetical protein
MSETTLNISCVNEMLVAAKELRFRARSLPTDLLYHASEVPNLFCRDPRCSVHFFRAIPFPESLACGLDLNDHDFVRYITSPWLRASSIATMPCRQI